MFEVAHGIPFWVASLPERPPERGIEPTASPTPGSTADPFATLAAFGRNELKGNERRIIESLVTGEGRVSLADLALTCEWVAPYKDTWNAARKRLNEKLHGQGWDLTTYDSHAIAQPLEQPANSPVPVRD